MELEHGDSHPLCNPDEENNLDDQSIDCLPPLIICSESLTMAEDDFPTPVNVNKHSDKSEPAKRKRISSVSNSPLVEYEVHCDTIEKNNNSGPTVKRGRPSKKSSSIEKPSNKSSTRASKRIRVK